MKSSKRAERRALLLVGTLSMLVSLAAQIGCESSSAPSGAGADGGDAGVSANDDARANGEDASRAENDASTEPDDASSAPDDASTEPDDASAAPDADNPPDPDGAVSTDTGMSVDPCEPNQPNEELVNQTTQLGQRNAAIAIDPDCAGLVVFEDASGNLGAAAPGPDRDGFGIRARPIQASGRFAGAELSINASTAGDQRAPNVLATASGRFVITYTNVGQLAARVYDAANVSPLGAEFRLDTSNDRLVSGAQLFARVDRGFGAVWQETDSGTAAQKILVRVFDADGLAAAAPVPIAELGFVSSPVAVSLPDSRLAIAWLQNSDGMGNRVFVRIFDAALQALTNAIEASDAPGDLRELSGAANAEGRAFFAWRGPDADADGIFGRIYDADGLAVGRGALGQFEVSDLAAGTQSEPAVIAAADRFMVVWSDGSQTPPDIAGRAVRAMWFDRDGVALAGGASIVVNTATVGSQLEAAAAPAPSGSGAVVVWTDLSQTGADTDAAAVKTRALEAP